MEDSESDKKGIIEIKKIFEKNKNNSGQISILYYFKNKIYV